MKATPITGSAAKTTEGGTLTMPWEYTEGKTVPASTGVLLHGEAGKTYTFAAATSTENAPDDNWLKGAVGSDGKCVGSADDKFYMLSYDATGKKLGFYWGAADGAPFTVAKGKAYLAIPASAGHAKLRGFSFDEDIVTAIEDVQTERKHSDVIYNLQGVRVQNMDAKGIYIVNGKKVIR